MAVIDKREFKRGDIYWFDYEYLENNIIQQKKRPGIIVSNNGHNKNAINLEIVYLTTSQKKPMTTHVTINSAKEISTAKCECITTVEKITAGYFIGHCTDDEMKEIDKALMISLDLQHAENLGTENPQTPTEESPSEDIMNLKIELAKARAEADLMKELYSNLLQTTRKQ